MLLKGMEFDTAHFITDVSGKYPRLWALKGAHPVTVNRWYMFGVLTSIRTIAPGFREISELPDWVGNAIQESFFHFMKLQRPDHRSANYIKHQETKPELVINLTEDEVTIRRAWGVWVCLTEMDKVKYPFKIYQNSVNGSFLLNTMTGNTTRFANEVFEQKRTMIWENKLIGTENTRRKACNMMHVERWHERICQFCATQEKPLFGRNFLVKRDRPGKNEKARPSHPQGSTRANTTY
ncbi:hypothetical protein ACS0TY_022019 [Phlomoides rotata]